MSDARRYRRHSERALCREDALLEIKTKIKHFDKNIANSREKIEVISRTVARESNQTENSTRKTSQMTEDSHYSTNGETASMLVSGKMYELKAAQQRADDALQDLSRLRKEVLLLADNQINAAVKEFERTKARLKEEYEAQLKLAETELHRKIKEIKEQSQHQIESKLSFYQSNKNFTFSVLANMDMELDESQHELKEKMLLPQQQSRSKRNSENVTFSKNQESQYSNLTGQRERHENIEKSASSGKKAFHDIANSIEDRLQYVKDTIADFKSKILIEKTVDDPQFQPKDSIIGGMRKTANSSARKVRKLSMQILNDISLDNNEEDDDDDFEKYLALKRKIQGKKKKDHDKVPDRKSIR